MLSSDSQMHQQIHYNVYFIQNDYQFSATNFINLIVS